MKYYYTLFTRSLFCLVALALLNFGIGTPEVQAQAKWTFMVYLGADCDLEPYGLIDFNEMESVGSTSDMNIIVEMDRAEGYDNSDGNWTTCKRFRVTQDADMNTMSSAVVQDLGEVNMGDPAQLTNFIQWATTNYPAENYVLVLWNHGGGWQKKKLANDPQRRAKSALRNRPFEGYNGPLKDVVFDESSNDFLSNIEVRQAVENSGVHLDIIAHDACLMGMIEIAYELKGVADILVSSEETEPGDGWPYNTILSDLKADPDMTPQSLSSVIVQKYGTYYSAYPDVTQSAVDLSKIEDVATKLDALLTAITDNGALWAEVETAREATEYYYVPGYRDLWHFADQLSSSSDAAVQTTAGNLKTSISSAVIDNFTGSQYPNSGGIAIYFPASYSYNAGYGLDDYGIAFPKETQWADFLKAYHNNENGGGGGGDLDDYEPNGCFAMAYGPVGNTSYQGNFSDNDYDFFRLVISETSIVSIDLEVPAGGDFDLYLMSLSGGTTEMINWSEAEGFGDNEQIVHTLEPGVYYVEVSEYEASSDPYTLTFSGIKNNSPLSGIHLTMTFDYGDDNPLDPIYNLDNGDIVSCQYNPPYAPAQLMKIWYYITDIDAESSGGDGSFEAIAMDYYGDLMDPISVTPAATGWYAVDVSDQDIIVSSPFEVGMRWDGTNMPEVGYDESIPSGDNFYYSASEDTWYLLVGSLFIRAELYYETFNMTSIEEATEDTTDPLARLYPNPATDRLTIDYTLLQSQAVNVILSELTGQVIEQWHYNSQAAGSHRISYDVSHLAAGMYNCRISTGQQTVIQKFVKQ